MKHNQFLDTLTVPEGRDLPVYEAAIDTTVADDDLVVRHGSPFSPEQMSRVFARNGYPEEYWAIIPVQPFHLDNAGNEVLFGEGPTVSAGRLGDAYSRAFLNKRGDPFIGLENHAGFSSSGFVDGAAQAITTVPHEVGRRLVERQPSGYLYRVDTSAGSGFELAVFDNQADAIRDAGEYRSARIVKPLGVYTASFVEFCEAEPVVVVDCEFNQLQTLENEVAVQRALGDSSIQGAEGVIDFFAHNGVTARLLTQM